MSNYYPHEQQPPGSPTYNGPVFGGQPPAAPAPVVIHTGRGCNHAFHALMTLITCGFWLPVWIIAAVTSKN